LPFLDHVHHLDVTQNDGRAVEILKPEHRPGPAFDGPMVLLHDVVQVLDLTNLDGHLALGIHRVKRGQIGAALVDGHRLGRAILNDCLSKKRCAAALSRLARNRKSMVFPALSTAR
jgi:hypothetical protein